MLTLIFLLLLGQNSKNEGVQIFRPHGSPIWSTCFSVTLLILKSTYKREHSTYCQREKSGAGGDCL